jgi:hypothetical protein
MPRKSAVLLISSSRVHINTLEVLRLQDISSALLSAGYAVDLLVPKKSNLLTVAISSDVRIFTALGVPFSDLLPERPSFRRFLIRQMLFLRAYHLLANREYDALHGFDDGSLVARALDRATVKQYPYISEIHVPLSSWKKKFSLLKWSASKKELSCVKHAAAVIFPHEKAMDAFQNKIPHARISIIPEPEVEITPGSFTFADYSLALRRIYDYILR